MWRDKRFWLQTAVVSALVAILSACATVGDQRVDVLYQSTSNATGGTGEVLIAEEAPPPSAAGIQWIIGEIRNNDGEMLGNTVTDTAPTDLLTEALIQELKGAGYRTLRVGSLPPGVGKGIIVKNVTVKLDEVKSAPTLQTKCKVTVSVEPWVGGKALSRVSYESNYSETAVTGRDELPSKTLLQAIKTVMAQAVPEIVRTLEGR